LERNNGEEDCRLPEASGAGRFCDPVAAHRAGTWSARLNIMEFCKAFNAQTQEMEKGAPIPDVITYYQDKSFTFEDEDPPVSFFLKKAAKLQKGSKTPGRGTVGPCIPRDRSRKSPKRR
jgi:hypothetical protein